MDLIIRNARLADRRGEEPLDIAVAGGKIVAIERSLAGASEIYDAGGRLACGGLIETHIHLDKSRIIDRCPPEDGREISPMKQVAALKPSLTEEDVRARAERTLVDCILNRAPPRRRAWLWLRPVERLSNHAAPLARHGFANNQELGPSRRGRHAERARFLEHPAWRR
jgi:hypothetical protein